MHHRRTDMPTICHSLPRTTSTLAHIAVTVVNTNLERTWYAHTVVYGRPLQLHPWRLTLLRNPPHYSPFHGLLVVLSNGRLSAQLCAAQLAVYSAFWPWC
jgi:hypothetical protein